MKNELFNLIDKLEKEQSLTLGEYQKLIENYCSELALYSAEKARHSCEKHHGNKIFIRGLIEISSYCKNDCYYCGIRKGNKGCQRYRLTKEDILSCCKEGYALGFRTFVMQGGEDAYYSDEVLCEIIGEIKRLYPDCAVTLSLGERSRESYEALYKAGADRYLLRHETATKEHYEKLHPKALSFEERMRCLRDLKEIGYQVGCGFMVGSPYQTSKHLAADLKFIEEFSPHMCGIGPFITHKDTPFRNEKSGSADLTVFLLSLIRLIKPNILLPATTALGTVDGKGRERGVLSGANVVMPNLSPLSVRKKYMLYDNKIATGQESAQCVADLKESMKEIGYEVVTERGDFKNK
ncbi:MAG: [Clostridia bacterium]|nr:[FeFe] hydrogenase H-cluster radical SAM maturase HydE [Clostridia bacterium]